MASDKINFHDLASPLSEHQYRGLYPERGNSPPWSDTCVVFIVHEVDEDRIIVE